MLDAEPRIGRDAGAADRDIDCGEDPAVAVDVVGAELGDGLPAAQKLVPHLKQPSGSNRMSQRQKQREKQSKKRQGRRRVLGNHGGMIIGTNKKSRLMFLRAATSPSGNGNGRKRRKEEEGKGRAINESQCLALSLLVLERESGRKGENAEEGGEDKTVDDEISS